MPLPFYSACQVKTSVIAGRDAGSLILHAITVFARNCQESDAPAAATGRLYS